MIALLISRLLAMPPWAGKLLAAGVFLAAAAGVLRYEQHAAYERGRADALAQRTVEDQEALYNATARTYSDQKALSDKFLLAQRDRFKENQDAQANIDTLRAKLRAGAAVLRLPAGSAVCPGAAPASAAAGAGPGAESGPVELVPGIADAFVSIAGRIAAGVRRENDLIDAYERCRDAANKP